MGRNQTSYHLDDYIPLLEKNPRAVFDAAPVKQNIPAEVLDSIRSQNLSGDNVIKFLHFYANKEAIQQTTEIKDLVKVQQVDLHKYDALCVGKEVAVND